MKNIVVLGATGSIGGSTLDVIKKFPEKFRAVGLAAGKNAEKLCELAKEFEVEAVAIADEGKVEQVKESLSGTGIKVFAGKSGVEELATLESADLVVVGIAGTEALFPTLAALKAGKCVALASKEPVVVAGEHILRIARENGACLVPVDSEPNAIFQLMAGVDRKYLKKITLTASGGPFYKMTKEELEHVTPRQALAHPVWRMGEKITIDSATLMNKGLEVIEASCLFSIPVDRIEVVIHPQSVIHSLVELIDGTILGAFSVPDMRVPILYALSFPERNENGLPKLDLVKVGKLEFYEPDYGKFPCLALAYEAGKVGGTAPAVLSGADLAGVEAFLEGKIKFTDIPRIVEEVLEKHTTICAPSLEEALEAEKEGYRMAKELIEEVWVR